MPPDMPFDPADLPEEVADTGWQREADSPLPPPLGTPTDNAAFMAGQPPPQAHWWDARPPASAPAPAPEAPSGAEQRIEPSFADELPSMSIFDPSQPAEPELGAVATPEAAAFDVDFDLDALTPPSVAGALPELPAFDAAAAQPADAGDRAATPPAADLPGASAAKVVTLADLALPVPEVLKPLSEDEAAAHFESFAASLVPKAPAGPPTASDWTTDISFDLPSVPGAQPPAPPRRRELADASATELMFPTIPGNDIELVVDGKLQQPPPPPPAPVEPAWSEPSFESAPEPSPESLATPDISLDLLDDFVSQPAQPTQSARVTHEAQDEFDDSRPVAGEELLDIDLFEPAPEEEPYSEPLTQMAELPAEALPSSLAPTLADSGDSIENLDQDLFPVFEEEALDLLPVLTQQLQSWRNYPSDPGPGTGCMRTLHTFKGGARLAGAMRLGELAHAMEATIENILGADLVDSVALAALQPQSDKLIAAFETLRSRFNAPRPTSMSAFGGLSGMVPLAGDSRMGAVSSRAMPFTDSATTSGRITVEPLVPSMPMPLDDDEAAVDEADLVIEPAVSVAWRASQLGTPADLANARAAGGRQVEVPVVPEPIPIDWAQLVGPPATAQAAGPAVSTLPVRVRPQLLDRLVNLAGEVSITRARLESEVGQMRGSLVDLSENLDRLNQQLRDVALQAETQLESRMEAARALSQAFDPLELDRYTRLQELTRMMAESVNDVATVRTSLQRTLQTTEDELAMQGRLTRELQGDLLRTRMLEFDSLSERLQRVVRQAAAESGKQTRLDIAGGSIEVDRGVLDRMTPAFEHLLRNCVGHGIEYPETRAGAGKDPTGSIVIAVQQEGNEVSVEIRDDGAGLDLLRIRDKALAMGLLSPDALPSEHALAQLIFAPGLSTAGQLTELSGRGVGMDVVRSDVQALGGRIEIHTQAGVGTRFKLVLPLTTVVTQVVLLRAGGTTIAVPSHLIELVQRASSASLQQAYASGSYLFGGMSVPFYWLGALLESSGSGSTSGRTRPVIIVRSAQQRVALHVDEVQGNQEVVVKNLGAQLSRLPGLAGLTLLASGGVALIYNPVALATVYGTVAHEHTRVALNATQDGQPVPTAPELAPPAPLVLVVDDSLTVRRVTRRLLEREGWRVAVAKDGMEALESLANERPVLVLSDIEMPRMDGFDLLRNIRADAQFGDLPVIMITSRIAQKHREHALQLGANHYLGKPYAEEELLALVRSYAKRASRTS
ncbi:MAG: response regulator [Burkholderiales bacterium]|nr:response regulator [Burkholderiales bacterium]